MPSFQFPSNGKAYPKGRECRHRRFHPRRISFNSLQTGKRIQSTRRHSYCVLRNKVSIPFKRESVSKGETSSQPNVRRKQLFQFPSNGKAYPKQYRKSGRIKGEKFQFPSNGKAYPKSQHHSQSCSVCNVSIPFKRESVSKEPPF